MQKKREPICADDGFSEHLRLSWDTFHNDSLLLAGKIQEQWPAPFRAIVAITRGGQAPSLILSRELDIRQIDTFCMVGYSDFALSDDGIKVIKKPSDSILANGGEGVLVVDDLVDSGKTLIKAREIMPNATYAVVYAKPKGRQTTDIYVKDIPQDTWIHFPWDLALTRSKPLVGNDS